ncbi:hypothetical protein IKO18_05670 [bacterium]|jgi:hypothetical protein|nr:hypothetical protein [bacterium]
MTKKEYIMTFLDKVKDVWEPARGFVVLMRYNVLNDEQIDELFSVFKNVVRTTSDEQKRRKLERAISAVESIRAQERSSRDVVEDLDKILSEE